MSEKRTLNEESDAVQTHLTIMQAVIQRMGENSRACKVWCVTLVSAVLVLVARTGDAEHATIALAPTVLFLVLDSYYLSLERGFRRSYNYFVGKIHQSQVTTSDLYVVAPSGSISKGVFWAIFRSFSVLPFYVVVTATVLLAWRLVF